MKRGTILVGIAKHNEGMRVVVTGERGGQVYARLVNGKREFRIDPTFYRIWRC